MGGMIDLLVNGTGTVEHVGRKQVIYPDAFLTPGLPWWLRR